MWAIALWALAHIPPNGDAASLILFGSLAFLALAGTLALDAKKRRSLGAAWGTLAGATSNLPFAALAAGRAQLNPGGMPWWLPVLALLAYAASIALHPFVIGVPAVPG